MLNLITDRTILDVVNKTDKGFYNYNDVNRVGLAVQYLAGLLNGFGYSVAVSPKTNWIEGQIPTKTEMMQYISDLTALKNAFYGTTVLPSNMDMLTTEQANNIEKLLKEIETYITNMLTAFRHSGMAICGLGGVIG